MFKRLFISLIILSALSSEGAVVLQRDYLDLLLCAENQTGIFSDCDITLALCVETADDTASFLYNDALSFSSAQLVNEKRQLKYNDSFKICETISKGGYPQQSFDTVCCDYSHIQSREPIIEGTDSSPPLL
jgi:hypothetical protein